MGEIFIKSFSGDFGVNRRHVKLCFELYYCSLSPPFPLENPRVGLALIFRPCLPCHGQTPARCLRPAGKRMPWRAGRGFVVRDLPWTVEKLRVIDRKSTRLNSS